MSRFTTVLLSAVAAAAVATPASAAPKHNTKSPQETSAYWTTERMKNAKPRERAKPGGGGGGTTTTDWSRYAVPLTGGAYGGTDKQNGKLFMTIDGGNYVCSGTAVDSTTAGVNLVWTAGHCVTNGTGHAATNLMFVPGYYRGAEPNGRWTFTSLDSTPGWEAQGGDRFDHDVGAARVQRVGAATATFASAGIGTRPIVFNQDPTGKRIASYGYPASGKFNGSQQYVCASPFRRWDTLAFRDPMQISCDMTGGSSGGGWFLDSNASGAAEVGEPLISVNSYGYQGERNTMYGPYMGTGSQAQALYGAMD